MKSLRHWGAAAGACLLLASCGGGGDDGPRVRYGKLVSFGDSLSDVGTHRTPGVAALGGGKYTVNGPGGKIWIERLADDLELAAPCPAQTGLEASGDLAELAAPITNVPGCFAYAQGGSRVTNPVGPYNKALLALNNPDGFLGQITDPVVNQISRHLAASGGSFAADDLVVVAAGGNDVFINLATLAATVGAGGNLTTAATTAVTAMGTAGAELAAYVKNLIVARGAARVVVVNLPDLNTTPFGIGSDGNTKALLFQMASAFNAQLSSGLAGVDEILLVSAFVRSQEQAADPARFNVANATSPACAPVAPFTQPYSLFCSVKSTVPGDVSRYEFADSVHPTPLGYLLLAQLVTARMVEKGWR